MRCRRGAKGEAQRASTLLVEEYFASADERFLPELLGCRAGKWLKSFAERWSCDTRPWARAVLLEYVDDGCDRPCQRALVKALFRRAEAARDDEALAHFMAAFDRFPLRRLVEKRHWDPQARRMRKELVLAKDPGIVGRVPKPSGRNARNPQTGELMQLPPKQVERFSARTRRYSPAAPSATSGCSARKIPPGTAARSARRFSSTGRHLHRPESCWMPGASSTRCSGAPPFSCAARAACLARDAAWRR